MPRQTRELTTLRFDGLRFEGAWLDVDVLPDLVAYKELIIETAKELWRRDHPSRTRLPAHFDAVAIKFREIRAGSTIIPLVREVSDEIVPQLPFENHVDNDHFDTAAAIIEESIDAAARDIPLPDLLPQALFHTSTDSAKHCARARPFARKREPAKRKCATRTLSVCVLRHG